MIAVEELTSVPEEQALISALDVYCEPMHRSDVQHHNYGHPRNDVIKEVFRLDDLSRPAGVPPAAPRRVLIASVLTHDIFATVPLDPSQGYTSKEQRSGHIAWDLVQTEFDFSPSEADDTFSNVESTEAGKDCTSEDQVKLRRADIKNVSQARLICLATSVNIFREIVMLQIEQKLNPVDWPNCMDEQQKLLRKLLSQDLTLPFERQLKQVGAFNRAANRNVNWLSSDAVRDPAHFVRTYGRRLTGLVPTLSLSDLLGRDAA